MNRGRVRVSEATEGERRVQRTKRELYPRLLTVLALTTFHYTRTMTDPDWSPMLEVGDLQVSLYLNGTLEIRDGQYIYVELTKEETEAFLKWIDQRDR